VELTNEEWLMACDSMVQAGQISSPARNEMVLISEVLGLESLVDLMAHERLQSIVTDKGGNGNAEEITVLQYRPSSYPFTEPIFHLTRMESQSC